MPPLASGSFGAVAPAAVVPAASAASPASAAPAASAASPASAAPVAAPGVAAQVDAPRPAPSPALAEAPPAADEGAGEEPEAGLPKVALSGDLLFRLLKAELEFKRGNWQGPYVTLMGAAQQTRDPRLARRATEMALAAKQADEALAAVRLWRELAPDSEDAAQYYLGFLILSDNIGEAEPIFRARLAQASAPRLGVTIFQIQQFLGRARDKAGAGAMLARLLTPYAATPEAHLALSHAAFARGDGEVAVREAQAAIAIKPDSELAVLTLAQVTSDQDAVAILFGKFLQRYPQAREVRAANARALVGRKQYLEARDEFLLLHKAQPDNLSNLYALGIMSMQLGESAAAEKYFVRFIDVLAGHPNEERDPSKVLMILSQLAEERGDGAAALAWLEKIDSGDAQSWFAAQLKRAQLIGKQGDVDGAAKLLAELRADAPREQVQVLLAQAQILRDANRTLDAFGVLEAGAKRFPSNPELLYDYALLAEKTGRLDVMEASLRTVIAHAPDNQHAYNALGYSLAERNIRLNEAFELIDKALKMAPDDPFIMDSMGWVQYRLGHLDQAEQALRRAYALRGDAEIAVHLGEVLWQKGQKDAARKLWREARSKDPNNDALKDTLARLNSSL
ncbi:MAG: tetratricopeptide repeat protein [Pseudomonadota bacterium]